MTDKNNTAEKTASPDDKAPETIEASSSEKSATSASAADDKSKDTSAVVDLKPEEKKKETKAKPAKEKKKTEKAAKSAGSTLATLGFLISLGAVGGGYWLWQQLEVERQNTAELRSQILAQLDTAKSDLQGIGTNIESNVSSQLSQANDQLSVNAQRTEALETSLKELHARIGNTSRDWIIAESDYLLQIANHRLQLQRDIPTTIAALKLANERLRSVGEPALFPVRELLAAEINTLETFDQPDIESMALSLASMTQQVPQLPLKVQTRPASTEQNVTEESPVKTDSVEALPGAIWDSLKGLVSIRYHERPMEPLLTPTQVENLYENLQLKLEQARLALLKENTALYKSSLDRSVEWLKAFFNQDDVTTNKFISKLESLAQTNIKPALPDISESLTALRKASRDINFGLPAGKKEG